MHARAAWPFRVYARSVPVYALALVSVVPGLAWADAPPAQCGVATTPFTRVPALPALNAGGATTFTMKVAGVGTVWDVDVQTFLRHSYTSDLSVTLTSPAGTTVTLSSAQRRRPLLHLQRHPLGRSGQGVWRRRRNARDLHQRCGGAAAVAGRTAGGVQGRGSRTARGR